jgi:predicted AlkP superfamily phosphohydrolase/phosphomutase
MPGLENIDLARSQVLPANFGLQLYVHRADRFAQGPVQPNEAEEVCRRVSGYLLSLRDPLSGDRVIERVYRAEEIYPGPRIKQAPDLVIEYRNMYRPGASAPSLNPGLEGRHERQGIFLAHGPKLGKSPPEGARIEDVAPTVLHLLDLPVPEDMDGRVLIETLAPDVATGRAVQFGPPATTERTAEGDYSPEEKAEVEEQLRALGYIA